MGAIGKKIAGLLSRPWRVTYRLTVIVNGKTMNTYGKDRKLLMNMAKRTEGMDYWALYKSGPLGLPEREVDGSIFTT